MLAVAIAAVLCGMRGYKATGLWAQDLSERMRTRLRCRHFDRTYLVPSTTIICEVLIRVDPDRLDQALRAGNTQFAAAWEPKGSGGLPPQTSVRQNDLQAPSPQELHMPTYSNRPKMTAALMARR